MTNLKLLILSAMFGLATSPALALDGDIEAGAKVFKKCAACHAVEEAKNKVGPHLNAVLDRPVGAVEGFKYSQPMQDVAASGKVWDEAYLAEYLANPRAVVKGTRMAFAGLKKEQDVADVIAYLKSFPPVQ